MRYSIGNLNNRIDKTKIFDNWANFNAFSTIIHFHSRSRHTMSCTTVHSPTRSTMPLCAYYTLHSPTLPYQCGFRKNRSTLDHLVCLESYIRNAFIRKEHAVAIFFDLEKAYDTTWKYGIMKDLHSLGFRGHLPKFISSFLSDRTFQVQVGCTPVWHLWPGNGGATGQCFIGYLI